MKAEIYAPRRWSIKSFFSFHGRAPRLEFWVRSLVAVAVFFSIWFGLLALMLHLALERSLAHQHHAIAGSNFPFAVGGLGLVCCFVLYGWALLAASARRCHDLGMNFKIEIFDFRVTFACAFKRGTVGPNPFGPDPLSEKSR